ncbi:MAG: MFS transporter [Parachlamydia sp.]|nr:MFS transporter [Parachlamydia sp.]
MFYKRRNVQLFIALLTAAIDFFHLGLAYPIFSKMVIQPGGGLSWGSEEWQRTLTYSLFIAAFPFGQFVGSPFLGRLSDRFGRKRLLFLTVAGSGFGMALCAFGVLRLNPTLVLLGRLLGGFMGANLSLAYAAIIDLSTPQNKVRNLALIPLSASTGFCLGPLLSGILGETSTYPLSLPLWIAVFVSALNWAAIWLFDDASPSVPEKPSSRLLNINLLWRPILLTFLMVAANFLLVQFIGPFSVHQLNASLTSVSWLYVNVSTSVCIGHLVLTRNLASFASPRTLLPWSLAALACSLVFVCLSANLAILHIAAFLAMLCCAVAYTNVFAYLSDHASAERQGEIMGLGVSTQCLAEWLPPLCVGSFAAGFPAIPMLAGAIACLFGIGLLQTTNKQLVKI